MDIEQIEYEYQFNMVLLRHGIELLFCQSSEFDGIMPHGYASREIMEIKCKKCQNDAFALLHWIIHCRSDEALAEWVCMQYSYTQEAGVSIVCESSPRTTAIKVLLEDYRCDACRK